MKKPIVSTYTLYRYIAYIASVSSVSGAVMVMLYSYYKASCGLAFVEFKNIMQYLK